MWLFLFCSMAFADETAVTLNKGEKAPFTGTLLSPEAAAKIIVNSESDLQKCIIDSQRDLSLLESNLTFKLKNKEAELAACTLKSIEHQKLYEKQISFLEKQAVRPEWVTPVYFITGVLTGAAIVYGSSVVLQNIGSN